MLRAQPTRLSLRSTRGGKVTLWLWERTSGDLRQLLPHAVAPWTDEQWLDGKRLLVAVRASADTMSGRYPRLPSADGLTASVLESGTKVAGENWPQAGLTLVNVAGRTHRAVAPAMADVIGNFNVRGGFRTAPGGQRVAVVRIAEVHGTPAGLKQDVQDGLARHYKFTVDIHSLVGPTPKLSASLPKDIRTHTLRWSANGRELAFLAAGASRGAAPNLLRIDVERGHVQWVSLDAIGPDSTYTSWDLTLDWTNDGDLVVGAGPAFRGMGCVEGGAGAAGECSQRYWQIARDGGIRAVTEAAVRARGVAGYDVVAQQRAFAAQGQHRPAPEARLVAVSSDSGNEAYVANGRLGLSLWRVAVPSGRAEVLLTANTHLRHVAHSTWEIIHYTTLNGEPATAALLRPVGVAPGVRVPLVVHNYPGAPQAQVSAVAGGSNSVISYDIYAARGYAALFPSMPWALQRQGGQGPLPQLLNGVLPAVDSVIAKGIADPDRLFVAGGSFGGFGAVGLVTQTDRFKAAVASAGLYNMSSAWGTSAAPIRFAEMGPIAMNRTGVVEMSATNRMDMGGPPWTDPERYVRNSPVFFAHRIQTPVLLIHGDQDGAVPMEQSEEMFNALQRLGNRARFVRYWGEPHGTVVRPANIRDRFYQELAWFDEFGDIARDERGNIIWEQGRAKSRGGKPALTVADFARFDAIELERRRATANGAGAKRDR